MTGLWERVSMAGGLLLALLLAFALGMMVQSRRALQPAPKAGFIQTEAPRAEIRTAENRVVLERRNIDAGRLSRATARAPKDATPTRQTEILAETKSGEFITVTATEYTGKDGTRRNEVETPEGTKAAGVDYAFPALPEPREKRWTAFAIARTDFRTGTNIGAAVAYHRGRFCGIVAGFRGEAILGLGWRF